jgi:cytochrome c oxidase cbb3-type subunit I/II
LKIEENLKNDPDFVKSYNESKKKPKLEETFVPMNEIVALIAYIQVGTDIKVKIT